MSEYYVIDKIFLDIHTFIIDYVKLCEAIHENSNEMKINIRLIDEDFYFPATFNEICQRINELQYQLQRQIRILAQKRRNNITKGIENDNEKMLINNEKKSYRFDENFKIHLEELQKNLSDKNLSRIQVIIDAFELYEDMQIQKYSSNNTFRLLPIIKHIQKQLCCISKNIQKILENHSSIIEQHFKKLQESLNFYQKNMRNKLTEYTSRDIRPPVLVIPCPTNIHSPEIFTQFKSSNAVIDDHNSDHNLIQITNVSSEDSLSIENHHTHFQSYARK